MVEDVMAIAMGYEHEELEDELEVRWTGLLFSVDFRSRKWVLNSDSSIGSTFRRGSSSLTWILLLLLFFILEPKIGIHGNERASN
jgi:hypothetical protein